MLRGIADLSVTSDAGQTQMAWHDIAATMRLYLHLFFENGFGTCGVTSLNLIIRRIS
jgi:thiamine pyrophosphate-dependent acetolactate synthase large subunit-like protein